MTTFTRYLPWLAVSAAAAWLVAAAIPPASPADRMDLDAFGRLPCVADGRTKPLDTLARNSLMIISDRQTFRDEKGERQAAIRWLLDAMSGSEAAQEHKVFRIENEEVLGVFGLEPRPGFRYSAAEVGGKFDEFLNQLKLAHEATETDRTLYQRKLIELEGQLALYVKLSEREVPHLVPPRSNGGDWQPFAPLEAEARRAAIQEILPEAALPGFDPHQMSREEIEAVAAKLPAAIDNARQKINPAVHSLASIFAAYRDGDAAEFNRAVANYHRDLQLVTSVDFSKTDFEVFFNRVEPFYQCIVLYGLVFLLACTAWLGWERPLNRTTFGLLLLALIVHTLALCGRMYLQGRPPVTTLYSSAIFIGWGSVVLALVLERIYRNGVGTTVAAMTGFLTLIIAHNLAGDGDTLVMMQAVLDTNFWLATHVTAVTTGYASTFMAGMLATLFIHRGVLTRSLDKENVKTLGRMIYGVICFALFFSFVGTVLGGIWADQSWGRFWGWDPKENGALMIVLWNALILHARWGGIVRERGMAVLAVLGNIVTSWSWFGVNMLGQGLHSYGFMSGAVFWLGFFVVTQLFVAGLGMLPVHLWRSFSTWEDQPRRQPHATRGLGPAYGSAR